MKAPITSAQAMSHPAVVETINALGKIADELRAELESDHAEMSQVVAAFQESDAALRAELAKHCNCEFEGDVNTVQCTLHNAWAETLNEQANYRRERDALAQGHTREQIGLRRGAHASHCYQGEYLDTCKYGDDKCPMQLDDRREGLDAHHVYCRTIGEDV